MVDEPVRLESVSNPNLKHNSFNSYREVTNNINRIDPLARSSVNWGAIFTGAFISILSYFTLTALGLAIGGASLAGIIAGEDGSSLAVGSGIWLVVTAFISLFLGSYFSARVSGPILARVGGVQGLVITSLFFGFLLMQAGSTIGLLGQGLSSTVKGVSNMAGNLSQNPQVQDVVDKAVGDLNLKSSPQDVAKGLATRLLRGDDTGAKNYLAQQAGISRAEADSRITTIKNNLSTTVKDLGTKAAKAASIAGWTLFGCMLLGALFAVIGGGAGALQSLRSPLSSRDEHSLEKNRAA